MCFFPHACDFQIRRTAGDGRRCCTHPELHTGTDSRAEAEGKIKTDMRRDAGALESTTEFLETPPGIPPVVNMIDKQPDTG